MITSGTENGVITSGTQDGVITSGTQDVVITSGTEDGVISEQAIQKKNDQKNVTVKKYIYLEYYKMHNFGD